MNSEPEEIEARRPYPALQRRDRPHAENPVPRSIWRRWFEAIRRRDWGAVAEIEAEAKAAELARGDPRH